VAPSAPASLVRDRASRCSPCDLTPDVSPELLSWGSSLLQSRTVVRLPALRRVGRSRERTASDLPSPGFRLSWVSCSLERLYAGCPLSPHHDLSTAARWVEVARPPPVPSSGFLPLSTVLATHAVLHGPLRIRRHRGAPTLRGLVSCRSRPGVALQSFPFSRSRTRSRGPPASLRVRARPTQRRGTLRGFRGPFRLCVDLLPRLARRLAGLQGRDKGSLESLDLCA